MASLQAEDASTWTIFPSLLSPSESDKQRAALEDACCAQYCGRYAEAAITFDTQLPPSHLIPIVALQRADMLSDQGKELERIQLLKLTLDNLSKDTSEKVSIQMLIELMLADAEFWAHGKTNSALTMIYTVKDHFCIRDMENLTDLEVRTVLLYHSLVSALDRVSNSMEKNHHRLFPRAGATRQSEIGSMRRLVQNQTRWRIAPVLMQYEMSLISDATLAEAISDAVNMCNSLAASSHPSLKFQAVTLGRAISLKSGSSSVLSKLSFDPFALLASITPNHFTIWEDFCPKIASEIKLSAAINLTQPAKDTIQELLSVAKSAELGQHYTRSNQAYVAARNCASHWNETATKDKQEALSKLKSVQKQYISFLQSHAQLTYFLASALGDHATTLRVRDHDFEEVLRIVEDFQIKHLDFAIPEFLERLLDHGMAAARQLDMHETLEQFQQQHGEWIRLCKFWKGKDVSDEAILDPEHALRKISHGGLDPLTSGQNACGLMLHWAAYELERKVLSAADCEDIFGIELSSVLEPSLAETLRKVRTKKKISNVIFGSNTSPTSSKSFLHRYKKLLDWVRIPHRLPSLECRIFALRIVFEARLNKTRQYLSDTNVSGWIDTAIAVDYEAESRALVELRSLESSDVATPSSDGITTRIHITLVKTFARDASGKGLADDSELVARVEDCNQLIKHCRDAGHRLREYHTICQLLRLTWQRYAQFGTVLPESIMPIVNHAEAVFIEIRNSIANLDPPETLLAGVKLSDDFSHREHHHFALAGRLTAFCHYMKLAHQSSDPQLQQKAADNLRFFVMWALKSKGRGYTDIINIESAIGQEIAQAASIVVPFEVQKTQHDQKPESVKALESAEGHPPIVSPVSSQHILSPRNPNHVNRTAIEGMLARLPSGVVVVDFLDVGYAKYLGPMVAIMYRKNHTSLPFNLPGMSMETIDEWVKKNINVEQEKGSMLSEPDAEQKLAELSGLLRPLLSPPRKFPIQPEETVIFCPTGNLSRIPLHAIPIDGKPFIERNAVVYCQSLTILHWLWQQSERSEGDRSMMKRTVLNPMPEPISSTDIVRDLSCQLQADFHHGFDLKKEIVKSAVEGSLILHYHGHAHYDAESALDSVLVLNKQAYAKPKNSMPASAEVLTARDFFKVELARNALATIIACGSGVAAVSSLDDVVGFTTALFFAGAGAVVSTLWPLDDVDGAAFSHEFYAALFQQKAEGRNEKSGIMNEPIDTINSTLDLAKAFRSAVIRLRQHPDRQDLLAPYHWASFTLNGFWLFPTDVLPDIKNASESQRPLVIATTALPKSVDG